MSLKKFKMKDSNYFQLYYYIKELLLDSGQFSRNIC